MASNEFVIINNKESPHEKLLKYIVGFTIVFYVGMLFGAAWVPKVNLIEWFNNFCQFVLVEHHFIVGFTEMTPKVIAIFEGIYSIAFIYYITRIDHPFRGREYGDAEWGDAKKFTAKYGDHDEKHLVKVNFGDIPEPSEPIYVNTHNYWLAEDTFLSIDNKHTSNLNIEVVGPPGTGKSFRLVRPILSQLAGNFLVTDPKGELSQQTGQYMEDNGYGVFVINCQSEEGMKHSHHFNPFRYIECESDILGLCEVLFKATTNPDASNSDQFFEDMAQVLCTDIFYLMHYTYPEQDQDWEHFVELLNSTAVKADPKTGGIDLSDPKCFYNRYLKANELWKKEHNGENLKGFEDVEKIYTGAQETSSSIVSSLDAHCKFMKLDCVVDLLSEDDLDFVQTFGYKKVTQDFSPTGKYIAYLVTSENERYYDWIPSMIYSLFISKLYHITGTDEKLHQTLPVHLTFLMDEFANVTLPNSFVGLTSTMRSRGISVVVIIQNLQQLKDKFPKNDQDKNLRSNMSTCLILGGPDMDSCETLSKEFLKQTINKQTQNTSRGANASTSEGEDVMEHSLLPADKIFEMDKDGPCYIRIKGTRPLAVSKVRFENSPLKPLLTRKKHYKISEKYMIKPQKYDFSKSPCEQLPTVYIGKEADEYKKQCIKNGVSVAKISQADLEVLATLDAHNAEITGTDASTKEFWKQLYFNTAKILEEARKNVLDLDSYTHEQLIIVQRLRNTGFMPAQIRGFDALIRNGTAFDEIMTYFNPSMSEKEITDFAVKLVEYKSKYEENA